MWMFKLCHWSWVSPSWGERIWYLLISGWKSTAYDTTVTCFWLWSYRLSYMRSLLSLLSSSKTKHQYTEHVRQLESVSLLEWETYAVVLSRHVIPTVAIWLTKILEELQWRVAWQKWMTLTNGSSVQSMSEMACDKAWSVDEWCERHQCEHVCAKEDITHANVANLWSW